MAFRAGLWDGSMSEKRTKSGKSQWQAEKLEKKARHLGAKTKRPETPSPETRQSKLARIENSPSQRRRERNEREDFNQAAARVREATKEFVG